MTIKEIMSTTVCYLSKSTTLQQAAQKMLELDCGFIPVGDGDKLDGIVTDRDIAVRGVAKGLDGSATLSEIMSTKVLYCYETDDTQDVAKNMAQNQVRRLVVLNNPTDKKLAGVVAVCDITTANETEAATSHQMIKSISTQSPQNNQSAKAA